MELKMLEEIYCKVKEINKIINTSAQTKGVRNALTEKLNVFETELRTELKNAVFAWYINNEEKKT